MKKVIAVFLTLTLALVLCACGNAKSNSSTEEAEQGANSAAEQQSVEYFSEYEIIKPSNLKFTGYDKENKMYYYDLSSDTSEALELFTEYIDELEESGIKLEELDKDKHSYLIVIDDKAVGGIGIVSDPSYGIHQMSIMFAE